MTVEGPPGPAAAPADTGIGQPGHTEARVGRAASADSGGRRKPFMIRRWVLILLVIPAMAAGQFLPMLLSDEDAAPAPKNPCSLIAPETLRLVVPAPKITRSEASNSGPYSKYGYCDVETDSDEATSTAEGSLRIELDRNSAVGNMDAAESAQDDFAGSKKFTLEQRERLVDVRGLGDAAFAQFPDYGERRSVRLHVLAGADVLTVSYTASPSRDDLVLAAAVAVAKSMIKRLSR